MDYAGILALVMEYLQHLVHISEFLAEIMDILLLVNGTMIRCLKLLSNYRTHSGAFSKTVGNYFKQVEMETGSSDFWFSELLTGKIVGLKLVWRKLLSSSIILVRAHS